MHFSLWICEIFWNLKKHIVSKVFFYLVKKWQRIIFTFETPWMINVGSTFQDKHFSNVSCYQFDIKQDSIQFNLKWSANSNLSWENSKNLPKLSLSMLPQVGILWFFLEVPFVLPLIQLWIGEHQLTCMILGAEGGRYLMSKQLIIVNSWIEKYIFPLKEVDDI